MRTRTKTIIGALVVAILLVAQQPVAQGPQAGNAAAWLVVGGGTAGVPGTAALTVQGIGSGTPVPISGTVSLASNSQANAVPQSTSTFALTAFDLAATAATQVKASGGNVWGWYGYNPNTSTCFLQFYNSTSATLGTSALHPFGILAGGSFNISPGSMAMFNLGTGISTGETTTATGSTPCTSAMVITISYQ
jgi:hypothetical protein